MAKTLRSAQTVANVIGLARSNPEQVATVAQWDADPWLLGTPGGTVDLRTGTLRPARPLDYITKQTAVTPAPPVRPHRSGRRSSSASSGTTPSWCPTCSGSPATR